MSPRLPNSLARSCTAPQPLRRGSNGVFFFINLTELAGKTRDIFWHSLDHKRSRQLLAAGLRAAQGCLHGASMPGSQLNPPKAQGLFLPMVVFLQKSFVAAIELVTQLEHMNSVGFLVKKMLFIENFLENTLLIPAPPSTGFGCLNSGAPCQGIFSFQIRIPATNQPKPSQNSVFSS